ncbi:MAG: hypothetical protein K2P99_01405, partial [Burkholderiales bacterium]|nr:hypothetical protein [Burkholderiales bacterium]
MILNIDRLILELEQHNFRKNSIDAIAEKYGITESALEKIYISKFFSEIAKYINPVLNNLANLSIQEIEK